jgi:hypothetical protein
MEENQESELEKAKQVEKDRLDKFLIEATEVSTYRNWFCLIFFFLIFLDK